MTETNDAADGPLRPRRDDKRHGAGRFIRDILIILLAAILISFLIKTFLVRSFYIPSPSMTNTLQVNDKIIVNELVPRVGTLKHGDVIVFTDPGGWLSDEQNAVAPTATNPVAHAVSSALTLIGLGAQDSDNHLIKRVIGLPGDKVTCCNALGQLEVNGIPIKEPYINVASGQASDAYTYSVTVPAGDLWVLGDNRYNSADSAFHQFKKDVQPFVPVKDVVGRAFVISWPISRWTTLSDYPDVFRGVSTQK